MSDPALLFDRQELLASHLVAGWPSLGILGMSPPGAAAAVGNATQENNCLSVTMGTLDHASNGLFQWRLERLTEMQAFALKWFTTWEAIEPQAAFFSFECKRDYPALWADLVVGTKPLATLTANICDQYERPAAASAMLDARIKYATTFMAAWPPVSRETPPEVPVPAQQSAVNAYPQQASQQSSYVQPVNDLTLANLTVIRALANGIITAQSKVTVQALAAAIVKETS
jgi:hypothetical protein